MNICQAWPNISILMLFCLPERHGCLLVVVLLHLCDRRQPHLWTRLGNHQLCSSHTRKKTQWKRISRDFRVDSEISCQTACVGDIRCLSYNFGATKKKGKFICQLSDSDRFTSHENFTEDVEVVYRGIQVSFFPKSRQYVKDIFTDTLSIELKVESVKLKLLNVAVPLFYFFFKSSYLQTASYRESFEARFC